MDTNYETFNATPLPLFAKTKQKKKLILKRVTISNCVWAIKTGKTVKR